MAVDFDFDTNYNDEDEDQVDEESEDTTEDEMEEEGVEEEESSGGSSPLRLILLILVILVGLCIVCWLASRFVDLPIPGLGGAALPAATQAVVPATATPAPVTEGEVVTGESAVETGEEAAEAPAGEEGAEAGGEEVEELPAAEAEEPTQEIETEAAEPVEGAETEVQEAEEEAVAGEGEAAEEEAGAAEGEAAEEETIIILTPSPVPGPTATPSPGEADQEMAVTATDCTTNTAPVADAGGPYTAMMGKGQAIVTFDGSGSTDSDGMIESFGWDFGDGGTGEGEMVKHGYTMTGTYTATLTIVDNCGDSGEDSAEVNITPAQTPPDEDDTDTDNGQAAPDYVAPPVDPALGTLGFCYQVQRGDTLSGIASAFGVALPDLAYVNGVSPQYYVIAGQGLFVPVREINPNGPNIYQVQPGDTMHSIAYLCGISVTELARANGTYSDAVLAPGQIVRIPPPWSY
jgi:LysM repeat protein